MTAEERKKMEVLQAAFTELAENCDDLQNQLGIAKFRVRHRLKKMSELCAECRDEVRGMIRRSDQKNC